MREVDGTGWERARYIGWGAWRGAESTALDEEEKETQARSATGQDASKWIRLCVEGERWDV